MLKGFDVDSLQSKSTPIHPAAPAGTAQPATEVFHPYPVARTLRLAADYRTIVKDPEFTAALIGQVRDLLARKTIRALSFDVFDTAMMRRQQSEATRFHTISMQFAQGKEARFSAHDALIARNRAARAAYTFGHMAPDGTREGKLAAIATLTCSQLGHPALAEEYIATELAFEAAHLVPNPLILALVQALPALPCIFLSDMYLNAAQIAPLLRPSFGTDVRVLSSADGMGSKRCGGMYPMAAASLGLDGGHILHFGDSLESDYRQAKRQGWQAFYLPLPDAERAARLQCHANLAASLAADGLGPDALLPFNC